MSKFTVAADTEPGVYRVIGPQGVILVDTLTSVQGTRCRRCEHCYICQHATAVKSYLHAQRTAERKARLVEEREALTFAIRLAIEESTPEIRQHIETLRRMLRRTRQEIKDL